jgi:four helix bundle protein
MSSLPSRSGGYWQAAPHRLTDSLTSILEHILQRFDKSPDNPFDHVFEWRVTVEQKTVKGDELADRLARYAGGVLRIVAELPETKEGRLLRDQLSRSGTAPGAHYAEARGGQSRSDFIHKVALAAKEARESVHWLRTAEYAGFLKQNSAQLTAEGRELTAILSASLQTARKNSPTSNR